MSTEPGQLQVPTEQSSDLRAYYAKHAKTDRLDAELLARLLLLHPEGLHPEEGDGPGDPLKRAVKIRSGLVHRRTTSMQRLDALLEIMGPAWVEAMGSDMFHTAFKFLATWANPHQVRRLGRARLARWFQRETRKAWGERGANAVVSAAEATPELWGADGLDWDALAADISVEAGLALELSRQIARLDERIFDLYSEADPDHIVLSAPGSARSSPARYADASVTPSASPASPPLARSPGSCPPELQRPYRLCRRSHQAGRRLSARSALQRRRARPQGGPDPCRALPAAHVRHRPPPQLRRVHHRRRASHPHRRLPPQRHPLRAARRRRVITPAEGRAIVAERYQIPDEVRIARRAVSKARSQARRDERTQRGVAERSKVAPVPIPA